MTPASGSAYALKGAPGSPYTRKMLALLRYRRMPYRLLNRAAAEKAGLPRPAVELLPTFYLPDAQGAIEAVTDSTPLIRRFEREVAGRAVRPADALLAFLDSVLEDFADEWLTKAMFHYRWHYAADVHKAGQILPLQSLGSCTADAALAQAQTAFAQRQIGRLAVVGSNPVTGLLIEASYRRTLDALDAHLRAQPFLMGARPGASDFAFYGQLTQLAQFDPTPAALALARSPRVVAWVGWVEDLSGLEPAEADWAEPRAMVPSLLELLREVGRTHVPLLLANARALMAGSKQVQAVIDGQPWSQQTVAYQGKCLRWLREEFSSLSTAERSAASELLERSGCSALVHEPL